MPRGPNFVQRRRPPALAFAIIPILLVSTAPRNTFARSGGARSAVAPTTLGRLIALTFDDGPKPYVLFGKKSASGVASPSLLDLLDREGVHATFFVMGWRLSKNADAFCRKDGGITCRQAAEEEHRRGHEIENHTYGHGDFRKMVNRYGQQWVLDDIDRASRVIQSFTGVKPADVRPPDWDIWPELARQIEARGYHVMSKSPGVPLALRDLDSEDYFCAGPNLSRCPKPSLEAYVLARIQERERKGVDDHILVFHELPETVRVLAHLIPELKRCGYRFVLLQAYLEAVDRRSK